MPACIRHLFRLLLIACAALSAAATAASPAPREVAAAVADTIAAHYWDADAARRIAEGLRRQAAAGDFDALSNPRELATALGAALQPHDRHFRVRWTPPGPVDAPTPSPRTDAALRDLRSGYGIRRVERLAGNTGLLVLGHFADFDRGDADAPARVAMATALRLLADTDALLIDLRDNGGGSPAMVGYLASAFLPAGADAYNTFRQRNGSASEAPAIPHPAPDFTRPLYVLVSARTGSAAEAFAYTLQQAGRALVVGESSAGAANPGGPIAAGHGFEVFVSTGSPRNPRSGTNWEGTGVQPDLASAPEEAASVAHRHALERLLPSLAGPPAREAQWIVEALSARPVQDSPAPQRYTGRYGDTIIRHDDGGLWLQRGRRAARQLQPVSDDVFAFTDAPAARVRFDRAPDGAPVALELLDAWGGHQRLRREAD